MSDVKSDRLLGVLDDIVRPRLEQYGPFLVELHLLGVRLGPAFVLAVPERAPSREPGEFVERKADLPARLAVRTPDLAKLAVVIRAPVEVDGALQGVMGFSFVQANAELLTSETRNV